MHTPIEQNLRDFGPTSIHYFQKNFTPEEQRCFYQKESWYKNQVAITYVFGEPWRYKLKIEPNIIREAKMLDSVLEQEYQSLENHIDKNHLDHKMIKLTDGKVYRYVDQIYHKVKYQTAKKPVLQEIITMINDRGVES